MARAVVLCNGLPLTPESLAPPGKKVKRYKSLQSKPQVGQSTDLVKLIQQVVHLGINTLPDGVLSEQIVGAVEKELIQQILKECDNVQVKAATRLGINRNTLHKKVQEVLKGVTDLPNEPELP